MGALLIKEAAEAAFRRLTVSRLTVTPTWATRSLVRRTVAALNSPTRSAPVICMRSATTVITIVIITIVMTPVVPITNANMYARHIDVDALRLHGGGRSDCRRADKDGEYVTDPKTRIACRDKRL